MAVRPRLGPMDPHPRSGHWRREPGFGVYVHIPFCLHRCHYCDFNAYEGQDALHGSYVEALVRDIESWPGVTRPPTSIFFGGGTPSLLHPTQLARVLNAVTGRMGIAADAEITIEVNPETVNEATFAALLDAGFGRFSVGVQSLSDRVLEGLGRRHGPEVALRALRAARGAGVTDMNVDLIYGSPWERLEDWRATVSGVLDLAPEHISAYALTVEEGTPLARYVASGSVPDVDGDVQAERHSVAQLLLDAAGYERYEISNFALPRRASRHNVLYWSAGDYLGFGAGAHGHVAGRRWWTLRLPRTYIEAVEYGRPTEAGAETLGDDARVGEALMLGLRLTGGVDLGGLRARYGEEALASRDTTFLDLVERGLLVRDGDRVALAPGATLVANEALCALL